MELELRIKVKLSSDEEKRWKDIKIVLDKKNNAKALKKLIMVAKL